MPFSPKIIGNPILPAIHGGMTGAFLETTAIIGVDARTRRVRAAEADRPDHQLPALRPRARHLRQGRRSSSRAAASSPSRRRPGRTIRPSRSPRPSAISCCAAARTPTRNRALPDTAATVPLAFEALPPDESLSRVQSFADHLRKRRTVRDFSPEPVAREIIETAIAAAASAPSGANQQPWTFVAISDPAVKTRIRVAAEAEEKAFYDGRAGEEWLDALAHLGTDWRKAVSGDRALADRDLPAALGRRARTARDQALLRAGIGRHRHRLSDRRPASGGAGDADAHALAHGLSQRHLRPPGQREGDHSARGRQAGAHDCRVPVIGKKPFTEIAHFL